MQASSGARREPLGDSPDVGPSRAGWESAPAPKCPRLLAATDSQVLMGMWGQGRPRSGVGTHVVD